MIPQPVAACIHSPSPFVNHLTYLLCSAALVSSISFVDALHRLRPVAAWGHVERVRMCQLLSRPEVLAAITRHHMLECGLPKLLIDSAISVEMQISSRAETAMQVFLYAEFYFFLFLIRFTCVRSSDYRSLRAGKRCATTGRAAGGAWW